MTVWHPRMGSFKDLDSANAAWIVEHDVLPCAECLCDDVDYLILTRPEDLDEKTLGAFQRLSDALDAFLDEMEAFR